MTSITRTAAGQSSNAAATCPSLPRQPRIGAAIASAVVSCALLASVVLGMSSMGGDPGQTVAQSHPATRA